MKQGIIMKVRNKKTGELGYLKKSQKHIVVIVGNGTSELSLSIYNSLNKLYEEWEEYEEKEPLIKNEKIRKAVKIWAEVNILDGVMYDEDKDCIYSPYGSDDTDTSVCISFDDYYAFKDLEHRNLYTLTELCGE